MKWGWVTILMIACSSPPRPVIRVCMVGDSITVGYDDINFDPSTLDGFRPATDAALIAKGANVKWAWVGGNNCGTPFTNKCQAGSGAAVVDQDTNIKAFFGPTGVSATNVQIFRVQLGTNNVNPRSSPPPIPAGPGAGFEAELTQLFTDIHAAFPQCAVSYAQIPNCRADLGLNATIAGMNTSIQTVVAQQVALGRAVIYEASANILDADHASGGVHFIASGNTKMAVVAANGIYAAAQLAGFIP